MKDIIEQIKKMDKSQLKDAVKQARAFVKTQEGKDLVEKIKSSNGKDAIQKNDIMTELGKNPELAKMISEIFNAEG